MSQLIPFLSCVSQYLRWPSALCFLLTVAACTTQTPFSEQRDSGPPRPLDVSHIPEPIPREELRTIAGNKSPYTVLGRTYEVMSVPEGYREHGVASWYGRKFHGRRTSNGEVYDMYGMTAAHKTLPIPSYVRVTNTDNRRSIIVRVNDRGPFHGGRVIDLSYTAAKKLGFENHGTAKVLVEYIDARTFSAGRGQSESNHAASGGTEQAAPTPVNAAGYALPANTFLQVGAFSQAPAAMAMRERLAKLTDLAVVVLPPPKNTALFKVHVGPFADNLQLMTFRQKLIDANFPSPHVVYP